MRMYGVKTKKHSPLTKQQQLCSYTFSLEGLAVRIRSSDARPLRLIQARMTLNSSPM